MYKKTNIIKKLKQEQQDIKNVIKFRTLVKNYCKKHPCKHLDKKEKSKQFHKYLQTLSKSLKIYYETNYNNGQNPQDYAGLCYRLYPKKNIKYYGRHYTGLGGWAGNHLLDSGWNIEETQNKNLIKRIDWEIKNIDQIIAAVNEYKQIRKNITTIKEKLEELENNAINKKNSTIRNDSEISSTIKHICYR